MLEHLRAASPGAEFVATAGDPVATQALHGCRAIGRQNPRELLEALRGCDVFLSGGGSLIQDVTSLRNVVYYTGLIRMARFSRKPVMVYAQGVGPLKRRLAQKLARAAFQGAKIVPVEVTADPVWALKPGAGIQKTDHWIAALRTWPGQPETAVRDVVAALRQAAGARHATLRFLPMQTAPDTAVLAGLVGDDEILPTAGRHPRDLVALAGSGSLLIGMRLHALIFAASQGIPVIALDYDPKVTAAAKLLRAPLLASPSASELERLPAAVDSARAPDPAVLDRLRGLARRNATLAAGL